jgi:hypothetical protein
LAPVGINFQWFYASTCRNKVFESWLYHFNPVTLLHRWSTIPFISNTNTSEKGVVMGHLFLLEEARRRKLEIKEEQGSSNEAPTSHKAHHTCIILF